MVGGLWHEARALLASNLPPQGLGGCPPKIRCPKQPLGGKRAPSHRAGFARGEGGGSGVAERSDALLLETEG